jgi:hypothetical protein
MNELNNAKYIKALFVDYILSQPFEQITIGSEVMFAHKKVVADLVILSNEGTEAYEIKACNDDFRKLENQLKEYNNVFDYVNVIVTENHFAKAKKLIPKSNGLILITDKLDFHIYRKPPINKKLKKEELLSTMTIKFLKKYFTINSKKLTAFEIRNYLVEKDIQDLRSALYVFLFNNISNRFSNFLFERGIKTHYEDVKLLSMPNKKVVL